jgi:hypothetical protein
MADGLFVILANARIQCVMRRLDAATLEPFPISLNHILVIASEAWRSSGSDSSEPVGSPRFARDDGVST